MGRSDVLQSLFDSSGRGLEIGPSHNPLMPKASGFNVEILDYLDANGLRRKYEAAGQDVSKVEEVDYISDGRPMTEVIGARCRYDWIVASHVIEHVPDLLAFLIDCEALLSPTGSLVLAVPDKRCCFDILRPVSTIGQVLQAHLDRRSRPCPGIIFDDVAYARKRNGHIGWALNETGPLEQVRSISEAHRIFEQACKTSDYIDMHCWVFVPSSFRLIINTLAALEFTGFREQCLRVEDGEFFVVLSTWHVPIDTNLGALALAAQAEERLSFQKPQEETLASALAAAEARAAQLQLELGVGREAELIAVQRENALNELISALTTSLSWRLTYPLRAFKKMIKQRWKTFDSR